ncbi:hypothetical protein BDR22DRAFT_824051 [Usnea florida]
MFPAVNAIAPDFHKTSLLQGPSNLSLAKIDNLCFRAALATLTLNHQTARGPRTHFHAENYDDNCFPVGEYFAEGDFDTIKFGRQESGWKPVEVYSKHTWKTRQPFWRHFSSAENYSLVTQVSSQIDRTAQELVAGDIFNLTLIGHGGPTGIILGGNKFLTSSLALALDRFKTNAGQVSYPASRSPSGRFRNSKFSGAFLRSLGFAHHPRTKDSWSPDAHIAFAAREGRSNVPSQADPQAYESADMELISRFIDVLFTDYVDLSFSQATQTARRVLTPTNPALPPSANTNMIGESLEAGEGALESEFSLVDTNNPFVDDLRVVSKLFATLNFKKNHKMVQSDLSKYVKKLADQLKGLRWRFRVQEPFWFTLEALANKDLIKLENLHSPVIWNETSEAIDGVALLLQSFRLVQECVAPEALGLEGSFRAPVMWLAILLVRCGTYIKKTFEFLMTTRILGQYDEVYFQSVGELILNYKAPEKQPAKMLKEIPTYGFWLPQSFDNLEGFSRRLNKRYSKIQWAYEACFVRQHRTPEVSGQVQEMSVLSGLPLSELG